MVLETIVVTSGYLFLSLHMNFKQFVHSMTFTINVMLKILDIMSLRFIYFLNKIGFILGAFNPNMYFLIM